MGSDILTGDTSSSLYEGPIGEEGQIGVDIVLKKTPQTPQISLKTEGDAVMDNLKNGVDGILSAHNDTKFSMSMFGRAITLLQHLESVDQTHPSMILHIIKMLTTIHSGLEVGHELIEQHAQNLKIIERKCRYIVHQSTHDSLTNLWNRYKIYEIVFQHLITQTPEDFAQLSTLYIDLDDFGKYNHLHGHGGGDQALRIFANTLKQVAGEYGVACLGEEKNDEYGDVLGRIGGEEFIVLAPSSPEMLKTIGEETNRRVAADDIGPAPFRISGGISQLKGVNPEVFLGCAEALEGLSTYVDRIGALLGSDHDTSNVPFEQQRRGADRRVEDIPSDIPMIGDRRKSDDRRQWLQDKSYALELYDRIYGGLMNLVFERADQVLSYVKANGKDAIMTDTEISSSDIEQINKSSQRIEQELMQYITKALVFSHEKQYGHKYAVH